MGRNLVNEPPVSDVQPVATSSFGVEIQHEKAWMTAVQDSLYVEFDAEKINPVMRSSFQSARSDAVGQPEICIEFLLPLFHEKAASPEMIRHGMELVKKTTEYLNLNQIPVLVVDQPLYVLAKKMDLSRHLWGRQICGFARWTPY